ncbi:hypothetical protein KUCAC02_000820 [Chaenocephalus aceratus]|uniref:Uncharacterized protein n=1 Tax=Chaenocephalus aceratus TaxID=36190 RepID=A0ACB9W7J1_CHAAC|nr:hypothetical protein KUCAC02_000820 [Chaenocephalus aceratus]
MVLVCVGVVYRHPERAWGLQEKGHGTGDEHRRHLVQNAKKMDCPAQITVSQVVTFPGFKIAENSKATRRELPAALNAVVAADPSTVEVVMEYHTCFTPETELRELMDSRAEQRIVKLTLAGGRKLSEIRRHLFHFVNDELFRGEQPPPRTRRRFYPTDQDIRNINMRWAHVFRDEGLKVAIDTNNGVERLNETLKYSHLEGCKNCSLSEMLTVLVTDFLPRTYRKYIELNVKYSSVYRGYNENMPKFFKDRPKCSRPCDVEAYRSPVL